MLSSAIYYTFLDHFHFTLGANLKSKPAMGQVTLAMVTRGVAVEIRHIGTTERVYSSCFYHLKGI
ncbi:MAG: hypothetical protein A2Z29_04390 [Chloroflexi bacterium RBG_16_56_11]|nr:MAG: hypothetical protein A2Z29_04390 [Chloroflexi bacterium RBG_16_56_11]